jgi:hypothetical protein
MKGVFAFSYVFLWALVVLEAIALREVLRSAVKYKRIITDIKRSTTVEEISWLRKGAPIPEFQAPLVDAPGFLTKSQLSGQTAILLFISTFADPSVYEKLSIAIHGMWHKTEGRLYILCNGTARTCRRLVNQHLVQEISEGQIPIALDNGGLIAESFKISGTPEAIELDEKLCVKRYGRPEVSNADSNGHHHHPPAEETPETLVVPPPEKALRHSRNQSSGAPCDWPDSMATTGAAFARVDTTVSCVMTRFRLRSAWSLIPFYLAFRRVRESSRKVDGLLKATFLIENLHTCYTMSLWKNECAIVEFGSVQAHVKAANSAFQPTWREDLRRAEIWSAQFRLWAVSAHNLNWEGLDLETVLADQWQKRERVARPDFQEEGETVNA